MAAVINKQKVLSQLLANVGKNGKAKVDQRPVLEQFIYAMLRENTSREIADEVFQSLRKRFFDWNEVRVSSIMELSEAMPDLPDAEARAQRIIDFLQEIFETTYSFDLDPLVEVLNKKGLKQASKQLARYQAVNDYSVAWVMQHSLGEHAMPLDGAALRVLRRMGLIEEDGELEELRLSIGNQIPKAKATQFIDTVSELALSHCQEEQPNCGQCHLRTSCPTGVDAKQQATPMKKPR